MQCESLANWIIPSSEASRLYLNCTIEPLKWQPPRYLNTNRLPNGGRQDEFLKKCIAYGFEIISPAVLAFRNIDNYNMTVCILVGNDTNCH